MLKKQNEPEIWEKILEILANVLLKNELPL